MTATIQRAQALEWRMERQFLGTVRAASVEEVVSRLVAVPAWSGDAETAVGLRLSNPVPDAVATALVEGRVLKTFAFRGSMNYFTPADAGTYLALRAVGRQWEIPSWREFYRLEPDDWPALREVVRNAIRDRPLTQVELAREVAKNRRFAHLEDAIVDRSFTLIKPLAWQGDLSLGPIRDGKPTLASLEGVPGWSAPPHTDEAGPRAILAYLGAYGPATPERVQYWLGEGLSAGRKRIVAWTAGLQEADHVAAIEVDGRPMLARAEDIDALRATVAAHDTHLLPGLDPWILGPGTADEFVVPPAHRAEITRGANIVLTGGDITGTWKRLGGETVRTPFSD